MTKTTAWSLFWVVVFVIAGVIIYKYADRALDPTTSTFKWGLGPTTVEPFDMCFTVGEEGGEPVLAPCRGETSVMNIETGGASGSVAGSAGRADVLAGTGSAARAAAQLADGGGSGDGPTATQSQTSALGETGGLDGVEVSGLGARSLDDGNVGIGQATGAGGGALWEGRRGDEAGTGDLSGICGDNEYTIGDMCCAKHLLPKDAVYGEAASSCSDWSCKHGYVRGASSVQCVVAGSTSAAVIAGDNPPLDAIGIIDGLPTSSSTVTIRVDSGSDANLGDGHVTVSGAGTDGTSISRTGRKKAARVFDFGPFNLDDITNDGSIEYNVVVPFNVIAPRADNTINLSFSYCAPDAYYKDDVDGTCKLASECGTAGFFTPGVSGGFGTCTLYTDCDNAPMRQQEVAGGTTDRVCCPPLEAESGWRWDTTSNLDPSCVQVCSTGALTNLGACPASAAAAPVCGPGLQLPSADDADGKRWYGDATSTVWDVSHGLAQTCTPCTAKPADAEWSGTSGCEWNCTGATWKSGDRCAPYSAASGCGTQNSDNRVTVWSNDNVACCQPTPQGEGAKWAEPASSLTGITLSAGVMGKKGTGACNISCEDGYYRVDGGRCERYTAATSTLPGCDVTSSEGVTYKRVKSDSQNYVCCDNKGVGEEWQESDFWTGTRQVKLNGDDVKGVPDMCGTKCAPGNWSDSSVARGECKPYTAVTASGAPTCDVWSDAVTGQAAAGGTPAVDAKDAIYRALAGGPSADISCCPGLGANEAWRYGDATADTASGTQVLDSQDQTRVLNTKVPAEVLTNHAYTSFGVVGNSAQGNKIGCQRICKNGYYDDGNGCVARGQSSSTSGVSCTGEQCCGLQIEQWDDNNVDPTDRRLRLARNHDKREVSTELKCCPPLEEGTTWSQAIPGWAGTGGGVVGFVGADGQVTDVKYAQRFQNACVRDCCGGWHQTGWSEQDSAVDFGLGTTWRGATCTKNLDADVACDGSACPTDNTDCVSDPRTYWDMYQPGYPRSPVTFKKCCNAGPDDPFNTPDGEYWTNWRWRFTDKTTAQNYYNNPNYMPHRQRDCSYVQLPTDGACWRGDSECAAVDPDADGAEWACTSQSSTWRDGDSCQPEAVCDASGGLETTTGASNSPLGTFYEPVGGDQGIRNRICCPDIRTLVASPPIGTYTAAQQSSLSHLHYADPATNDGGRCKLECDDPTEYFLAFTDAGYPHCRKLGSLNAAGLCETPGTCLPEGTCENSDESARQSKLVGGNPDRYAVLSPDFSTYTETDGVVTWEQAKRGLRYRDWAGGGPVTDQSSTGWNPYQMGGIGLATPYISPFGDGTSDVSAVRHCVACDATMMASGTRVTGGDDWEEQCSLTCNAGDYQPVAGGACEACVQGVYPSFNAAAGFPSVCATTQSKYVVLGMITHPGSSGFNLLPANTMLAPWSLVSKVGNSQNHLPWMDADGTRLLYNMNPTPPHNHTQARLMGSWSWEGKVKSVRTQSRMGSNYGNYAFDMHVRATPQCTMNSAAGSASVVLGNVYRRYEEVRSSVGHGGMGSWSAGEPFAPGGWSDRGWSFTDDAEMTLDDVYDSDAQRQSAQNAWVITVVDGDASEAAGGLPRLFYDNKSVSSGGWSWVDRATFVMGEHNPLLDDLAGVQLDDWEKNKIMLGQGTSHAWHGHYLPTAAHLEASAANTWNASANCPVGKKLNWKGCCECKCRARRDANGEAIGPEWACNTLSQSACLNNLPACWPDGDADDCQVYTQDGQAHIGAVGVRDCGGGGGQVYGDNTSVANATPLQMQCNNTWESPCNGPMSDWWGQNPPITDGDVNYVSWVWGDAYGSGFANLKRNCQNTPGCTGGTLMPHLQSCGGPQACGGWVAGVLWQGVGAECAQGTQPGVKDNFTWGDITNAFVNSRVRADESTYTAAQGGAVAAPSIQNSPGAVACSEHMSIGACVMLAGCGGGWGDVLSEVSASDVSGVGLAWIEHGET